MNRIFFLGAIILIKLLFSSIAFSQSEVLVPDSDHIIPDISQNVDSIQLAELKIQLENSRLAEMNLQMEIEQMKLAFSSADSLEYERQRAVIDSLRTVTEGVPVVVENDTLFYLYTNQGGLVPTERANQLAEKVRQIGTEYGLEPDSIFILTDEFTSDVMYRRKVIASFTDKDAIWMGMTRVELADRNRAIIVEVLKKIQKEHSVLQLIKHISLFILVVLIQYVLIRITNYLYRKLRVKVRSYKNKYLKPISIKEYEFLSLAREEKIVYFFLSLLRYLIILIQLIFSIPILFSIFPQTEHFAMEMFSYIITPIKKMGWAVIQYIPNLFTIAIIWLVFKYVIKGIGYLASEIQNEKLKITGFYSDWAKPSFNIIRFLLYVFMIVLIYQHLPYADSKIFQGMSVFVGLIVSFGSSSAIGNLVAGIIITYMRSFKIGDRIKLNDIIGNVVEKTPIVTRILTLKNEIITIPNSTIMNSQTTNLSESARTNGLIVHTDVTCSYSTPWKEVHAALIEAAERTSDVMQNPHPFVLEKAFNDFYMVYEINVYINDANKLSKISSDLKQHIQDKFNEVGISILSPHVYENSNKE